MTGIKKAHVSPADLQGQPGLLCRGRVWLCLVLSSTDNHRMIFYITNELSSLTTYYKAVIRPTYYVYVLIDYSLKTPAVPCCALHIFGEILHQFVASTPDGVAVSGLLQKLIQIKLPTPQAPKLNPISSRNITTKHYIW